MKSNKNSKNSHRHAEEYASVNLSTRFRRFKLLLLSLLSAAILVSTAVVISYTSPFKHIMDDPIYPNGSVEKQVSSTNFQTVCPTRVSLPDLANYGDSEFQESEGDLKSVARYASFGNVYKSSVHGLKDSGNSKDLVNKSFTNVSNSDDDSKAYFAENNVDKDSQILESNFLNAQSGTGSVASSVSWATNWDLKGLSATSCVSPSMRQNFIIPQISEGVSIRLNSINLSSKPTVVSVKAWSTSRSGAQMNLSTGSTFTVPAHSDSSFNISAAAEKTNGLYIQVSSDQAPVSSFVKVVRSQGLVSKGVDIIQPTSSASKEPVLPGITDGDQVKAYIWSDKSGKLDLYWLDDLGKKSIKEVDLNARQVQVVDLGNAPKGVGAIFAQSTVPTFIMASVERNGKDGQSDIAFVNAVNPMTNSAFVSPLSADETSLYIANGLVDNSHVTINAYDSYGIKVSSKAVDIKPYTVSTIYAKDINPKAIMFTLKSKSGVSFASRIQNNTVNSAGLAGVAWIPSKSLDPNRISVKVRANPAIVK